MTSWTDPVTLTGRRLSLTPLTVDDAADYLDALGDDEAKGQVTAHLNFVAPTSLDETRALLRAAEQAPDRVAYAQRLKDTGEFVGTTSFYDITAATRALAIGHTWIGRKFWRTGVNTDSKIIMLTRAFDGLGAERVVWHTDIRNTRSQAAIERLGATKEGILRHHKIRPDGSWRDTVQYSLLADEWPAARERLSRPRT